MIMCLKSAAKKRYNETLIKKGVDQLTSEAQLKAVKKYDAKATKQIKLKLNLKTDADILKKLEEEQNTQGYIKRLIREDLNK